jgi:hypothetical protein
VTWFKVDDSFYDHPKVFDAPDCVVALWTRAGSWAARNLTDGFVPSGMPARLCDDPERAIRELINRGLWERTKGGYRFHDWSVYQPMRSDTDRERFAKASGGTLGNHRRWHESKGIVSPDCAHCQGEQDRTSDRISDRTSESHSESSRPDPTRPDKETPKGVSSQRSQRRNRAADDQSFDAFWATYPRREAKGAARKAWDHAIGRASPEQITAAAAAYRDLPGRDPRYTKQPATWLNQDCWLDERPPVGNVIALRVGPPPKSTTDQRVADALAIAARLEANGGFQ